MAIAIKTDYDVSDIYASLKENTKVEEAVTEEEPAAETADEFYTNKDSARSQAMDMLEKYRNSINSLYNDAFVGKNISNLQTVNLNSSVDYQNAALALNNSMENIESKIRTLRLKIQGLDDDSENSDLKFLKTKSARKASEVAQSVEAAAKREVMKIRVHAGRVRLMERNERLEESSELRKDLQKIIKDNKVTDEDLKGLEVDIDS
ncbi:MAG: hypothetical protein K6F39_03290 [Lachnospiraceae bacterium]|nr:hypothetical protein [Lachnospiraceae bacterium]